MFLSELKERIAKIDTMGFKDSEVEVDLKFNQTDLAVLNTTVNVQVSDTLKPRVTLTLTTKSMMKGR